MAKAAGSKLHAVVMVPTQPQSITAFIAQYATASSGSGGAWRRWPPELISDIDEVIKHNDAHPLARVERGAFIDRALTVYGVRLGRHALGYYLKTQRGRKNWTTK